MNIIHIFHRLNRGGAELRTLEMMEKLQGKYKFHICIISGKKGSLDNAFEEIGVKLHYLKMNTPLFPFSFLKLLKKENIDVLHSHILFMSGYLQIIAVAANVKGRISHFRTSKDRKEENSRLRKIRNKFLKCLLEVSSTDLLYVSKVAKDNLFKLKLFPRKHKVVYNGFDSLQHSDIKVSETFVNVGRFMESKNQIFLLHVIDVLKHSYNKNIVITFLGNNKTEYGQRFCEVVQNYQLQENVVIKGEVGNPNEYLSSSEYFVFPSLLEGLPGALIEAHLNKCIVLTSNIPENKEVNSYFEESSFNLEIDANKWAYTINQLIDNNNEKLTRFSGGNPFSMEKLIENISSIYNKYK